LNEIYPHFDREIPLNTHQWAWQKPKRIWLHLLLFFITVLSTMMVGASFKGITFEALWEDPTLIIQGWQYSFAVLLILTTHEFGHYFAAIYHKMNVTLPFYIPLPIPGLFHFGTMGAFIRIKSPIPHRTALMDVAVAGPLMSFLFSVIFLFWGYLTLPDAETIRIYIDNVHLRMGLSPDELAQSGLTLTMGKSLLFMFFSDILGGGKVPMSEIYHFPFIFAGWIGFLVTAINLIPIGQLDGGHVVYALLGRKAHFFSFGAFAGMGLLSLFFYFYEGSVGMVWLPWMIILTLIGLKHPPTLYDELPINQTRVMLGISCIIIFFLCFAPLPIYLQ
jgi:membrane-associated protease RseP (regulator of RpoE activity)